MKRSISLILLLCMLLGMFSGTGAALRTEDESMTGDILVEDVVEEADEVEQVSRQEESEQEPAEEPAPEESEQEPDEEPAEEPEAEEAPEDEIVEEELIATEDELLTEAEEMLEQAEAIIEDGEELAEELPEDGGELSVDYTLYLYGGEIYNDSACDDEHKITAEIAAYGLSYAEGAWTMQNFSFTTTAATAIYVKDDAAVKLAGTNNVLSTYNSSGDSCGIYSAGALTINGQSGAALTVTGGASTTGKSCGIYTVGAFTISGSTVESTGGNVTTGHSYGLYAQNTLTISNGSTVTATAGTGSLIAGTVGSSQGIFCRNAITITDSKVTATADAANSESNGIRNQDKPALTITNSTVTATGGEVRGDGCQSHGIYIDTTDTENVNITGSTVNAAGGNATGAGGFSYGIRGQVGWIITNSIVNATGGEATFNSYGIYADGQSQITESTVMALGSKANLTSYGIYICDFLGGESLAISGGTVTAKGETTTSSNSYGIYSKWDGRALVVNNGNLIAEGKDQAICNVGAATISSSLLVKGGASEANAVAIEATKDAIVNDSIKYVTIRTAVCKIGETKFETVGAAVSSLIGDTIVMIADSTENVTIPTNRNITLDLNGYVLSAPSAGGSVITNNGTLTIKSTANSSAATHYFTYKTDAAWVLLSGSSYADAVNYDDMGAATLTSGTSVIAVTGGCITGGTGTTVSDYQYGGGIYSTGTLNMQGGYIVGNTAVGGGVYGDSIINVSNSTVNLSGGVICGNYSAGNGGGLYNKGTVQMTGGDIAYNATSLTYIENGGGVYNAGSFTMSAGSIRNNRTKFGGGVSNKNEFLLSGTASISGNYGNLSGGGVYNYGTFNMSGGSISGNINYGSGGGVYNNATFNLSGGSITQNTAGMGKSGYGGGGIFNDTKGTLTMSGTAQITANAYHSLWDQDCGGGVYNKGLFTMNGGSISGNTMYTGGGVYSVGTVKMTGGSITGNTATSTGGGVYVNGGTATLTGGSITGNKAVNLSGGANSGAGIVASGTVTLGGTVIIKDNKAQKKDDETAKTASNLFLPDSKTVITLSTETPLEEGAEIGVTTGTAPTAGSPVNITGSNSADYSGYFTSDNTSYAVINSGENNSQVVQLSVDYQAKIVDKDGKTTYYTYFSTACGAATTGCTVYLLKDVSGSGLQVKADCTVDLGGHTLSGDDVFSAAGGATVTLKNGTVYANGGKSCVGVATSGTLYVEDVKLDGYNAFYATGGHTYFGTGVTTGSLSSLYSSNGSGVLHVTDGVYTFGKIDDAAKATATDKLFVTGGCFKCSDSGFVLANYIPSGYEVVSCEHSRSGYSDVKVKETDIVAEVRHGSTVTKFGKLQDAINAAAVGDTVVMLKDITESVTVASNDSFTLDLNGYVLKGSSGSVITNNGTLTIKDSNTTTAHYFTVGSDGLWTLNTTATTGTALESLTARPSTGMVIAVKGGCITGGNASSGGGIYNNGTLTVNSGNIVGNKAYQASGNGNGGGIYNASVCTVNGGRVIGNKASVQTPAVATGNGGGINSGTGSKLTITGGSISYNISDRCGGGIDNYGELQISGNTEIKCNQAANGGGMDADNNGTVTISNVIISGNIATNKGGGILFENSNNAGDLTITGGSITANKAAVGGGLYYSSKYALTLGGTAQITGNTLTDGTTASNLYLTSGKTVTVSSPDMTMSVGVTTAVTPTNGSPVNVTGDNGLKDYSKYFTSDNTSYEVMDTKSGGVELVKIGIPVCKIGDTKYFTVADALAASSESGSTATEIVMIADDTENITIPMDRNIILDLNGQVIKGTGSGSVITNNGTLTIKDSKPTTEHKFSGSTYGKWTLAESGNTVNGGCITGGKATNGGGVYNSASATLFITGGNIIGNECVDNGFGGGLYNGKIVVMTGGSIAHNTTGISGCGGGVYHNGYSFKMTGGSVTGNTAVSGTGAGFYIDTYGEAVTVGGTAQIKDNQVAANKSNLYLTSGKMIVLGTDDDAPASTMHIGVTAEGSKPYTFVLDGGDENKRDCFFSDESAYVVILREDKALVLGKPLEHTHCECGSTSCSGSEHHANQTWIAWEQTDALPTESGHYVLETDVTISATWVPADGTYLCLNGHNITMSSDGAVIEVESGRTFTLTECRTGPYIITHAEGKTGSGVVNAGTFNVYGGIIRGNTSDYGGGIKNTGTLNIYGGEINRNAATMNGGGIYNEGSLTMKAGEIYTNTAATYGGGIYNHGSKASLAISGGKVYNNNAVSSETGAGGGIYSDTSTAIVIENAEVNSNRSGLNGGGIFATKLTLTNTTLENNRAIIGGAVRANNVTVSGCKIQGNYANCGGGLYVNSNLTLDGDPQISGNFACTFSGDFNVEEDSKSASNIGLAVGGTTKATVTLGSSFDNTNSIGVTLYDSSNKPTDGVFSVNTENVRNYINNFTSDRIDYKVSFDPTTGTSGKLKLAVPVCYIQETDSYSGQEKHFGSIEEALDEVGTAENKTATIVMVGNDAENVTIPANYNITLNLNGRTITAEEDSSKSVITNNGTLTITDTAGGVISGNTAKTTPSVITNNKTLTVSGGKITGGNATNGGGINNASGADLTVNGGEISGNTASGRGGAIYADGTVSLAGSANVTGNTAGTGGGVYVASADVSVGGGVAITGNTADGKVNNLYLPTGKTVKVESALTGSGQIGVTTQTTPTAGKPVSITYDNRRHDYHESFVSDAGYTVMNSNNGEVQVNADIVKSGIPVCAIDETQYFTIADALADAYETAPTDNSAELVTIKMIHDDCERVTVPQYFNIKLDLNGYVIDGEAGGTVITNNGTLEITDGESGREHSDTYASVSKGGCIYNGSAANGGGVYNNGTLKIYSGSVSGNAATANGGGVYNNGTLTMYGGTISDNEAECGGGVYNAGTLNMYGGTIGGSNANAANEAENGGGVYNAGTLNMTGGINGSKSNIKYNKADQNGGGVYNAAGATLTVSSKGTVAANTAENGGGVYNSGTLTVQNGTIGGDADTANTAKNGGGVYNDGTLNMNDGTIGKNTATENGGGVYNSGVLTLQNGTIGGNKAIKNGGGIYNNGTANIKNTAKVESNSAETGNGGGVYNASGKTLTVSGGTLTANTATSGGGVYSLGTMEISAGTLNKNTATESGGAVYNGGTLTMNGGTLGGSDANAANKATNGGGIYNAENAVLTLSFSTYEGTIRNNTATGNGGGVYNAGALTMTGGMIRNNTATGNGGGIWNSGKLTLQKDESGYALCVAYNKAQNGGGVYSRGGEITFNSGALLDNEAAANGGGLCTAKESGNIINALKAVITQADSAAVSGTAQISDNKAAQGGGIYNDEGVTLTIGGGTISSNTAVGTNDQNGCGGGIFNAGRLIMTGGTVGGESEYYANKAACGAGIYNESTDANNEISSAIISYNKATLSGGGIANGGALTIDGTTEITGNSAVMGGGVANGSDGDVVPSLTIEGETTISGNMADYGGGIANIAGAMIIRGSSLIQYNWANAGGGIWNYAVEKSGVTLADCVLTISDDAAVTENYAFSSDGENSYVIFGVDDRSGIGGGIYNAGVLNLIGGSINGNTADVNGGGVFDAFSENVSMTVGGDVNITANFVGSPIEDEPSVLNNVYLDAAEETDEQSDLDLDGAPEGGAEPESEETVDHALMTIAEGKSVPDGMEIGVSIVDTAAPTVQEPYQITTNGNKDDRQYFSHDPAQYKVVYKQGALYLMPDAVVSISSIKDFTEGSRTAGASFTVSVENGSLDIDNVESVELNGSKLTRGVDYSVSEGRLILTLSKDIMNKLKPGSYTLTVRLKDKTDEDGIFADISVSTSFTVLNAAPNTGDDADLTLWISLLGLSALAMGAALTLKRKKN